MGSANHHTVRCLSFKQVVIVLTSMTLLMLMASPAQTSNKLQQMLSEPEILNLTAGRTMVLRSDQPVSRVYVTNPEVAKADVFSPREIVLTGVKAGSTTLNVWHNKETISLYTLNVSFDLSRLKQKLNSMFPEEKELRVSAAHETITLSGRVSSTAVLSEIMSVAKSYAAEDKITNLVQVGGVHQVMLEVRVAEMSRSLGRQLGVNFGYDRNGDFGVTTLGGLSNLNWDENSFPGFPDEFSISNSINALFRFHKGSASWTGLIDALKSEGLVKIMAEPTLIALSGQSASFLAGGEFPYPVPQGLGTVAIEYRDFGVGLEFTPKVLSNEKININVTPSVSELDFSRGLQLEGITVPGLSKRMASTTVELADGQSFAIAGLLSESVKDNVNKFPFLGDVPVLGALFRSKSFQKGETELVIIATPHLVQPLDMADQTLPTDFYREPNDAEFYILGAMQGSRPKETDMFGRFDGEFGHALPE
jgi:pilus assembly protein CpaC